jgi:hypothetical protein
MDDVICNLLEEAPNDMSGSTAATPAANHLFAVSKDPMNLDDTESELFHHTTAKLLFLCKRACPDIQTAMAYLTTQIKQPDRDNYKIMLARVLKYLLGTPNLALTLDSNDAQIVKWWV